MRVVGLLERAVQALDLLRVHANATVLHPQVQLAGAIAWAPLGPQQHMALIGEFDGVAQQVEHDLAQSQRVRSHAIGFAHIQVAVQMQALVMGRFGQQGATVFQGVQQGKGLLIELKLAGLELAEVQDVVDDAHQVFARAAHQARPFGLLFCQARSGQQVASAQDAIHGGADFVADVGDEHGMDARLNRALIGQALVVQLLAQRAAEVARAPQKQAHHTTQEKARPPQLRQPSLLHRCGVDPGLHHQIGGFGGQGQHRCAAGCGAVNPARAQHGGAQQHLQGRGCFSGMGVERFAHQAGVEQGHRHAGEGAVAVGQAHAACQHGLALFVHHMAEDAGVAVVALRLGNVLQGRLQGQSGDGQQRIARCGGHQHLAIRGAGVATAHLGQGVAVNQARPTSVEGGQGVGQDVVDVAQGVVQPRLHRSGSNFGFGALLLLGEVMAAAGVDQPDHRQQAQHQPHPPADALELALHAMGVTGLSWIARCVAGQTLQQFHA